jgi:predicted enzyme related to lactoylglutathione lyase
MTHKHHTIDYIELNVEDLAASKAFYEQAFGWQFNDYGPDYAGIRDLTDDDEVGGLGVGRPPGPGGSLVILYSDDLEASVAAVERAGGTVTEGPYEFPGGRRFLFTDNSGNQLAVWTPA